MINASLVVLQMRARPSACGITDHSMTLARELGQHGVPVRLMTTGTGHATAGFQHLDLKAAPEIDNQTNVLVQLSAYGFDPRGLPVELERWLQALRRSKWRGRLAVFFHETWAPTWQPWKSAFWYCPFQKLLCGRIAALADIGVFNSVVMLRWGESIIGRKGCLYAPVFSNVGEPSPMPQWPQRSARCAVFGSSATRSRVYQRMRGRIPKLLSDWGLSELVDIGQALPATLAEQLKGLPIRYLGPVPAATVSQELLAAQIGLFAAPWGLASKSGVYAAYQAHGLVPISIFEKGDSRYLGPPGPILGHHFSTAGAALSNVARGQLSERAYNDYQHHRASTFSNDLVRLLT